MIDEINLNSGINPQIPAEYKPLPTTETPEVKKVDIVEKQIEEWNKKPEVVKAGVKADKVWKWNFWQTLGIMGILSILIIAIVAGIYGYILWKDKTMISPINLVCGNTTINVDKGVCPSDNNTNTNTCGNCICNMTLPSPSYQINLHCNSTG